MVCIRIRIRNWNRNLNKSLRFHNTYIVLAHARKIEETSENERVCTVSVLRIRSLFDPWIRDRFLPDPKTIF
jgi:hypothetical protein